MDGFKLLETIGLELDLPVISKLSPQMITNDRQLVVLELLKHPPRLSSSGACKILVCIILELQIQVNRLTQVCNLQ